MNDSFMSPDAMNESFMTFRPAREPVPGHRKGPLRRRGPSQWVVEDRPHRRLTGEGDLQSR
jgi:hypothetical protein